MDIIQTIQQCALNVEPAAIIALMKQESNLKPYRIGINYPKQKLKRQPANHLEAVSWSIQLIQKGYNIDMGLMQINSANLKKLGLSVDAVFNPCINLRAGAQILFENYQRASLRYGHGKAAFYSALSAYNTGHFSKGFRNGYVSQVISHLKQTASKPFSDPNHSMLAPVLAYKAAPAVHRPPQLNTTRGKSITDLTIEEQLRKTYAKTESEAFNVLKRPD